MCDGKKIALNSNTTGECGQSLKMGIADDIDVDKTAKKLLTEYRKAFEKLSK
ncbi:MAG: hypothetical protein RQM92_18100 [Candidatus Syntrophopropionicum ammoniitolerans]